MQDSLQEIIKKLYEIRYTIYTQISYVVKFSRSKSRSTLVGQLFDKLADGELVVELAALVSSAA